METSLRRTLFVPPQAARRAAWSMLRFKFAVRHCGAMLRFDPTPACR
jgi:hypothetical protein